MIRGEVWTVAGGAYSGKPRPTVIVQEDSFDATGPITVYAFTTDLPKHPSSAYSSNRTNGTVCVRPAASGNSSARASGGSTMRISCA